MRDKTEKLTAELLFMKGGQPLFFRNRREIMKREAMHNWRTDSDMETLAAIVRKNDSYDKLSPGVGFARANLHPDDRNQKNEARSWVIGQFSRQKWPESLSIFTMPSLIWRTEKSLLRLREYRTEDGQMTVRRTFITSIEREPAIYTASLRYIPGRVEGIVHLPGDIERMACTLRTQHISRFHCGTFEDFAEVNGKEFGAAWLDFTGPLTPRLLEVIPHFWNSIRKTLVITTLDARWCPEVGRKILKAGGSDALLYGMLPGSRLINHHRYVDKVPMLQVAYTKGSPDA